MTKAILGIGALLAVAVALAGCGGMGDASGTTGTVAGAERAQGFGNFRARVHGFEARVQTSVKAFRNGNFSSAIASGTPLLTQCQSLVSSKLSTRAKTPKEQQAVVHMQIACNDMSRSASAATGNVTKAKSLARQALQQAKIAARLTG
jgi:hypothetical protein